MVSGKQQQEQENVKVTAPFLCTGCPIYPLSNGLYLKLSIFVSNVICWRAKSTHQLFFMGDKQVGNCIGPEFLRSLRDYMNLRIWETIWERFAMRFPLNCEEIVMISIIYPSDFHEIALRMTSDCCQKAVRLHSYCHQIFYLNFMNFAWDYYKITMSLPWY